MKKLGVLLLGFVLFCTLSSAAMAYQNPNLNIGATDFTDPPAQVPGFVFLNNVVFINGDLKDGEGHSLPGTNKLSVLAYAPQGVYTSKVKLPWDISWGVTVGWPMSSISTDSNIGLKAANGFVGDPFFGVFAGRQHNFAKDWALHWMVEFDTYFPLGKYDNEKAFNPGANYYTFEPFLALRLQMPYGFELTTRQSIDFNTKNHNYVNPAITRDFLEHDYQAGDYWHFNWSFSKSLDFITPLLRFGVVGTYQKQISADRIDSNTVPDSYVEYWGIGPCLQWTYIPQGGKFPAAIFSLKTYWDNGAKNAVEGNRTVFRMVMPF